MNLNRRQFLIAGGAAASLPLLARVPSPAGAQGYPALHRLKADETSARLIGEGGPRTRVWSFGATTPGPELRVRQGERVRIDVENGLAQDITVHWHGLRVPNAMDGVPFHTQPLIGTGERFRYEFTPPDAGTHWYHPHTNGSEQIGRGLYGVMIVEERDPPQVDREVVLVLDDWLLSEDGQIEPGWAHPHDQSHAGRYGNLITVNGARSPDIPVRGGERVRFRLLNCANARIFDLNFDGHAPWLMALDGQPLDPILLEGRPLMLGPGMRADLIVDMGGEAGGRHPVNDGYDEELAAPLFSFVYQDGPPVRDEALPDPAAFPANPVPRPDLRNAERLSVVWGGGAMSGMMGQGGMHMGPGAFWTINGEMHRRGNDGKFPALFTLERGRSYILSMENRTVFDHPIHLHGYAFDVVSRNGQGGTGRILQDTVMMGPRETVDIAFVADNPGDWMFHCHILEHMESGMMTMLKVV